MLLAAWYELKEVFLPPRGINRKIAVRSTSDKTRSWQENVYFRVSATGEAQRRAAYEVERGRGEAGPPYPCCNVRRMEYKSEE